MTVSLKTALWLQPSVRLLLWNMLKTFNVISTVSPVSKSVQIVTLIWQTVTLWSMRWKMASLVWSLQLVVGTAGPLWGRDAAKQSPKCHDNGVFLPTQKAVVVTLTCRVVDGLSTVCMMVFLVWQSFAGMQHGLLLSPVLWPQDWELNLDLSTPSDVHSYCKVGCTWD